MFLHNPSLINIFECQKKDYVVCDVLAVVNMAGQCMIPGYEGSNSSEPFKGVSGEQLNS